MKLVLHIGTEKTGTTLLQHWLYQNAEMLSAQGVYLSGQLGKPNNRKLASYFSTGFDDFTRRNNIKTAQAKEEYYAGFLASLREEIASAARTHHGMIISSEHFHSRLTEVKEIEALYDYLNPLFEEIKILCYFREQSEVRQSLYSTGLKLNVTTDIDDFQSDMMGETHYYNYYKVASSWASVFGKENVIYRIYDRDAFESGDVRTDFLSALPFKVDGATLDYQVDRTNESVSYLEGFALRQINLKVPYWRPGGGISKENLFLKRLVRSCQALKIGKIADTRKSSFFELFQSTNRRFFDEYIGSDKSFSPPLPVDAAEPDERTLTLKEVGALVEEMFGEVAESVSGRVLLEDDIDLLRDVAIKIGEGAELSTDDAIALMRLAQRARPKGRLMTRTLKEWAKTKTKEKA